MEIFVRHPWENNWIDFFLVRLFRRFSSKTKKSSTINSERSEKRWKMDLPTTREPNFNVTFDGQSSPSAFRQLKKPRWVLINVQAILAAIFSLFLSFASLKWVECLKSTIAPRGRCKRSAAMQWITTRVVSAASFNLLRDVCAVTIVWGELVVTSRCVSKNLSKTWSFHRWFRKKLCFVDLSVRSKLGKRVSTVLKLFSG